MTWDALKLTADSNKYYNNQAIANIATSDYSFNYETFQDFSGETGSTGNDSLVNYYSNDSVISTILNHTFDTNTAGWGGDDVWKDTTLLDDGCMRFTQAFTSSFSQAVTEPTLFRLQYDIICARS